ncbi:unnamed protein product [Adineta ricciae]|uniref:Carrier domain-containing protein n=1 Tax=Adineta ricciae TaxID=249248 RepID=A0A815NXX6_ADIRI|nr:unnamed protein product [Adineta ricciae]
MRFDPDNPQVAIYNMPFVYHLSPNSTISVKQLEHALNLTVNKHLSLHTAIIFDSNKNKLMQRVVQVNDNYMTAFAFMQSTYETQERLNDVIHEEKRNPQLFNLSQGLVFRCHLVYYKQVSSNNLLSHKDIIIFNFHHASFDFPSMDIFLHDLNQAYTTGELIDSNGENTFTYLDYAIIEQQMSMTGASMYWLDILHGCNLDRSLPLPYDRYRLSNEHRTGRGISVSFDFEQDLSYEFLTYASTSNISLDYLVLGTYFILLFKLTNGDNDLCIGMNTHGRYRDEFIAIIGMFVNAIPLRCQLGPHLNFHKSIDYIQELMTNSMRYSYFPLQRILGQHPHISNPAFLDTSFQFTSSITYDNKNKLMLDDNELTLAPFSIEISEGEIMSKFDFIISFHYYLDLNQISCTIDASHDLFNVETVSKISQQFHSMLHQLSASIHSQINQPLYELSLILPNEQLLRQSMNNTEISFPSLICIQHEFVSKAIQYSQKVAVELDEQSLTYGELLYYVQVLSLNLLNESHISPGEVICQCVERSITMIIGIMAIEMVDAVYCPLSPRDPIDRLHKLIEQTQSHIILVHWLTKNKINHKYRSVNVDLILANSDAHSYIVVAQLSNIIVRAEHIAYIIFTSGSTGIPKAVQVRHRNIIEYRDSIVFIHWISRIDVLLQIAHCSFDLHVQDIACSLTTGASLVLLRPRGILDFNYLLHTIRRKNITSITTVPTLLQHLFTFARQMNDRNVLECLRLVCTCGEICTVKLITLMSSTMTKNCKLMNAYGPAETTNGCTIHVLDHNMKSENIPIGRPLANYLHIILDQYLQNVTVNQEGELFVGGVGVFAGYLGRDDLTSNSLIYIDSLLFYRTGDLVKIDNNNNIHYQGRKDHQIKLHGQRIELGEIERCLLNLTSISACVVIKWREDHLVAYIQSSDITEEQLHKYCRSHLPPHMIPSRFIILHKLPLNSNGKIDRKRLPAPEFASLILSKEDQLDNPLKELERCILDLWRQILQCEGKYISINTSFFTIGGHSLLFIELYYRYQLLFNFDNRTVSIASFLQRPTVFQHAEILKTVTHNDITETQWHTLHINQGIASFAQERIFIDEQIRFSKSIAIYNELTVLRVVEGSLSLSRLSKVFQYILTKHKILRTSLRFNKHHTILEQHITHQNSSFAIVQGQIYKDEKELQNIIYQTVTDANLFDLSEGRVFCCQIFRRQMPSHQNSSAEFVGDGDILAIGFHHAAFDRSCFPIIFKEITFAYNNDGNWWEKEIDEKSLEYIDYSVHERLIDLTPSQNFWRTHLKEYDFETKLSLPYDRSRCSDTRSSAAASVSRFSFDQHVSQSFVNYASSHHVTLFQLGLATFYVFLFRLTHSIPDICISTVHANRHRHELQNLFGMFVSTLPCRIQFNVDSSFDEFVQHVKETGLSILEHSHYPLQYILSDFRLNQSNLGFLETMFDFIIISENVTYLSMGETKLQQVSLEQSYEVAKFDFMLTFLYYPTLENDALSLNFTCSRDLFDEKTVSRIAERFSYCIEQLFSSKQQMDEVDSCLKIISQVNLILPHETREIDGVILQSQLNILYEGMSII